MEGQPHPSSLPWAAIPKFTPGVTNVQEYTQKLRFLSNLWPTESLHLLAPRVALLIEGTAFHKVAELEPEKLKVKDDSGVKLIVKTIGGSWGQTELEQRYEFFEKALYGTTQKPDESNDSFLSRMEHNFGELLKGKTTLQEVQAYVLLRQCNLHSEDRKRILLDHAGKLDYEEVKKSFRLVGSKFFAEVQGGRAQKTKVYDVNYTDDLEMPEISEQQTEALLTDDLISEETMVEQMGAEGDEDAILVLEYEQAAGELIQEDQDMATAFSLYQEARKRLAEKVKNRGFFPSSFKGKSRGKGKGQSGKSFGKGKGTGSLQSRILNSHCRLCGAKGHWKAECPMRNVGGRTSTSTASTTSTAPTSYATASSHDETAPHGLTMEFMNLSELPTLDDSGQEIAEAFMCVGDNRNHGLAFVKNLVNSTHMRAMPPANTIRNEPMSEATARIQSIAWRNRESLTLPRETTATVKTPVSVKTTEMCPKRETTEMVLFASQGTKGVVDLGATKTVIGNQLVPELLSGLDHDIRKRVGRCKCSVTFRFGNQSTLTSTHALVLPVGNLLLKVAVVPGATPFLLSNTLLRAIRAVIDTGRQKLISKVLGREIPLQLTPAGLFLLDVNELCRQPPTNVSKGMSQADRPMIETFSAIETKGVPDAGVDDMQVSVDTKGDTTEISRESSEHSDPSQVKLKVAHPHVAWSAKPLSAAAASARRHAQAQARRGGGRAQPERPGDHGDQLRAEAQGKELLASVGGHRVRPLVRDDAREEPTDRASTLQALRGAAHRRDRTAGPSGSTIGESSTGPSHAAESQAQSHAAGHSTGGGDHGGRDRHAGDDELARGGVRAAEPSDGDGERLAGGCIENLEQWHFVTYPERSEVNHTCAQEPTNACQTGDPGTPQTADRTPGMIETPRSIEMSGGDGDGSWPLVSEWELLLSAGEPDPRSEQGDIESNVIKNREHQQLLRLVKQIQRELEDAKRSFKTQRPRLDMLEVFADEGSQLTRQCQALGLQAVRLGRHDGDFETVGGRVAIWKQVLQGQPRHIWYSPVCSPWSAWARFNGARGLQQAKALLSERWARLPQVALGIVLSRFQREKNCHFHWEQPVGSSMFLLSGMHEPKAYLHQAKFDLCIVGELQDPVSHKPMKKGMQVWTTSESLLNCLQGRFCRGTHAEHQPIEGQTLVEGQWMSRTQFSQKYPRRFARQIAQVVLKKSESPMITSEALAVGYNKRISTSDQPVPKRTRRQPVPDVPATRALSEWRDLKRRRLEGKQPSPADWQSWQATFQEVDKLVPRVGKIDLMQHECSQAWKTQFPQVEIRALIACRGTDRMMPPPEHLRLEPGLVRRLIYIDRQDNTLKGEESWESVADRPRLQVIRKGPSCRLGVTAFGVLTETSQTKGLDTMLPNSETSPVGDGLPTNIREESEESLEPNIHDPARGHLASLTREERATLLRAHKNLGHPDPAKFAALLKQQGFRREIVQSAYEIQCETCEAHRAPKHARPSAIKEALDFNDRISVDGFTWSNRHGASFHVYHFIDHATNFHVGCVSRDQSSEGFIERFCERWLSWAGAPGEMITDSGTEFNSERFASFCQEHDLRCRVTSHEAAWQNAKCERHGGILKHMLDKFDHEHPIGSSQQLEIALSLCLQAKNATGLKGGYSPEVLVLGKQTRVAASIFGDENPASHLLAEDPRAEGIRFREHLAMRETARKAFHSADNDQALRRAMLRRSCPQKGRYRPGEWVMVWRSNMRGTGTSQGPMKVIVQEEDKVIWVSMLSKLFRVAPEHVRPVTTLESRQIPIQPLEPSSDASAAEPLPVGQGVTQGHDEVIPMPMESRPQQAETPTRQNTSDQPDQEPAPFNSSASEATDRVTESNQNPETGIEAVDIPVPETDDELQCIGLYCQDLEPNVFAEAPHEYAWRMEVDLKSHEFESWQSQEDKTDLAFLAVPAKKQRVEVKLHELSASDRALFEKAKEAEIANWLKTDSVKPLLRDKVSSDEIIRCRWLLVWKPLDPTDLKPGEPTRKAKARLVILGFQDPHIEDLIRDSPTLGKIPRMLLLQLVSSMKWALRSFDIKAAFLQGETEGARRIAVEPVPELSRALKLQANQLCQLTKGAYGLMDAPYLWYRTLTKELLRLGFQQSPFDPCLFILRHPKTQRLSGVLGIHVDDGLGGGDDYFAEQVHQLECKFPFGSKKTQQFTYTGIELNQQADHSITLSQGKYVCNIPAIKISQQRRMQENDKTTEDETRQLRALVGSLQYASVNTRPDLSCKLGLIQTEITKATVKTLMEANKLLHEAKKYQSVSLCVKSIPPEKVRFIAFSDASFASARSPDSRAGSIVLATHEGILQGDSCPVSPLAWGSKKIQRVVTSTLAAETMALDSTMDMLSWVRLVWGWFLDSKCRWQRPSEALRQLPEGMATVHAKEILGQASAEGANLPDSIATTDCKSLFDLISKTATPSCQEYRTSLHARSIKEMMNEGTIIRWVHSGAQLADALTKAMSSDFLRATLSQGSYQLHDAGEILKQRANARSRIQWLKSQNREP